MYRWSRSSSSRFRWLKTDNSAPIDALFIADLHLSAADPATVALAGNFLSSLAGQSPRLYILGDLFEYWIGDDTDVTSLSAFLSPLKALRARGVKTTVMHGNRDFLLGQRFARDHNLTLCLEDQLVADISGTRVLMMHGDTLCTDDTDYQRVRRQVRSTRWQQDFLAQSLLERNRQARYMREQSRQKHVSADARFVDVNEDAVRTVMQQANTICLVHGHTHRAAEHRLVIDNRHATRLVVGDWHASGARYGVLSDRRLSLRTFSH